MGSVNDNGFTSLRTAFEFSLDGIPVESTINSATLMFRLQNSEGTRGFGVDGYAGDGAPNLTDFGFDNLLGSMSIGPDPFFPSILMRRISSQSYSPTAMDLPASACEKIRRTPRTFWS